jgi:hypothetical protein
MTLDEFFRRLTHARRGWEIEDSGRVRNKIQCPLEAVAWPGMRRLESLNPQRYPDLRYYMTGPLNAIHVLGLSRSDGVALMDAADHREDTPLRARLLTACGLLSERRRG